MRADLRRNDPRVLRRGLRAYLDYLGRHASPAERLCGAGVPAWIVHAEKGDGGLTAAERRTLESCPHTSVITIPGTRYFLPDEEPKRVAQVIAEAVSRAG
jgi:pimeloyl-ACP methyl ester carboxylesterase